MKYQLQRLLRRTGSLIALALVVFVLVLISQRDGDGAAVDTMAQGGAEGTVEADPNPIVKISYKNEACTLYFEQNAEGQWYWTGNASFPLDSSNVEALVEAVREMDILSTQLITQELYEYGLDNPSAIVRYTTLDETQHTISVGSCLDDGTYYMTDDEDGSVHTIPSDIYELTRAGIIDMVVSENMPELIGCTLESITVSSDGQSWRLRTKVDEASGERLWFLNSQGIGGNKAATALIDCVPQLLFDECIDYDPSEQALVVCGLDEPAAQLHVSYLDKQETLHEYTLSLGNLRTGGETRFAMLDTTGAIYSISVQSVQPIFEAVGGALDRQ